MPELRFSGEYATKGLVGERIYSRASFYRHSHPGARANSRRSRPSQLCRTFRPPRSAGTQRWGSSSSVGLQRRRRVRLLQRGLGHCCGLRRQRSGRRGKRTEAFERRLQVFNARILLGRVCCRLHACNSAKGRQREKQAVSKINFNQNLVRIRPQRRTTCYVLNRPQYARLPCVPTRERGSR